MNKNFPSRSILFAGMAACLALIGLAGYLSWNRTRPPEPGSPLYEQYVEAFQLGVAALDSDLPQIAEQNLQRAVELVPQEPAGWADRGLLHLRIGRLPEAQRDLEQASRLAPDDPDVQKLLGLLKQRQGQFGEAVEHLRRALERDRDDVKARYLLAQIVNQEQQEGSDEEYQRLLEQILDTRPDNLLVLLGRLTVAVRRSDADAVRDTLGRLERLSQPWQERTRVALVELNARLKDPDSLGPAAVPQLLQFANVLRAEPAFPRGAEEVSPQDSYAGDALQSFRWLAPVRHAPAPPDAQLAFVAESSATFPAGEWDAALPVWLTADGPLAVFVANADEIRQAGGALTLPSLPSSPHGFASLDWNNDFRSDLLVAGAKGMRFYQQQADGSFADATAKLGLAEDVVSDDCLCVWPADIDLDGDLDVLVSRRSGSPLWLRNNFDGTFAAQPIFADLDSPQSFTWADFDSDGAPDAALLDSAGKLHVFSNERSGRFQAWSAAPPTERMLALNAADVNDDGILDILVLREDGALLALSDRDKQARWDAAELARWEEVASGKDAVIAQLLAEDFDNNGVVDLLASGPKLSALWLGLGSGKFAKLAADLPAGILAAADLRAAGRLDLLGIDENRHPFQLRNQGSQSYHWQTIRPQATKAEGDNRINSFGIGGEIEIRSGTHVVKQPIRAPLVHFGLGKRSQTDVIRIVWPNGAAQYEFNAPADKPAVAVQRLKGSCPFLFAWNGERFEFVTDFMWSTPLGMYINASDKGGFLQTTDWVKIRGDQLVAQDGKYELRVNANLWETHYFDHLALMVVDHPADTEMFVDERFCLEPSEPTLHLTGKPQPVYAARDHLGQDAIKEVRANDGVYLDRCGRGLYQGITCDHWVEVDLGDELPGEGPLWLVARGWIHPTDSSINYALEQSKNDKPQALVLELPDGEGGWKVGRDRLGFPAGKNKTILIRLDGLGDSGEPPRRFRLRTNMEIYWDSLQVARGGDDTLAKRQVLLADGAELRFRGILAMSQANPSSPELPHYDEVVSRGQFWRDLIGYHTRFGEIGELLEHVDDRYAILTAGDDVALRFAAPPEPPAGWQRDFVWVADGWVKDGDLNTRFGKTVLPLPAHDMTAYDTPPGDLEADPVYRRYPGDWQKYHTRYISPHAFERGLRSFRPRKAGHTSTP